MECVNAKRFASEAVSLLKTLEKYILMILDGKSTEVSYEEAYRCVYNLCCDRKEKEVLKCIKKLLGKRIDMEIDHQIEWNSYSVEEFVAFWNWYSGSIKIIQKIMIYADRKLTSSHEDEYISFVDDSLSFLNDRFICKSKKFFTQIVEKSRQDLGPLKSLVKCMLEANFYNRHIHPIIIEKFGFIYENHSRELRRKFDSYQYILNVFFFPHIRLSKN